MADYFVGDVQGCFDELQALLLKVAFNPIEDTLYLAGDIVARGPKSLATLRFVKSLGDSAKMVLGNHDLHLLAIHAGLKKAKPNDLLDEVLSASDIDELMSWLAQQPLLIKLPHEQVYLSHAGITPQWNIDNAISQAEFAQQKLASTQRKQWLSCMYGEQPNNWHNVTNEEEQFRFTINSFTRMRFCFSDNSLEFTQKMAPNATTTKLTLKPWYELSTVTENCQLIFGHWASLMGHCTNNHVYALDTGCVWGYYLTMLCWQDKKIYTEFAH